MTRKNNIKALSLATGTALALSMASTNVLAADANPFAMSQLSQGYQVAMEEGKCGGSMKKNTEAKCGGDMKKNTEAKCGGSMQKTSEGKCGDSMKKTQEAKCGGSMAKTKAKEGKCGEGKCGGNK